MNVLIRIVVFIVLILSFAGNSFAGDLTIKFISQVEETENPNLLKLGEIKAVKGSTVYTDEGSCTILGENSDAASIDFSLAFNNGHDVDCFFRSKKKNDEKQVSDQAKDDGFYWVFKVGTYEILGTK